MMSRDKLVKYGVGSLYDSEFLAIFLRTGLPGSAVLALAEQVLAEFGALRGVMQANETQLTSRRSIGSAFIRVKLLRKPWSLMPPQSFLHIITPRAFRTVPRQTRE